MDETFVICFQLLRIRNRTEIYTYIPSGIESFFLIVHQDYLVGTAKGWTWTITATILADLICFGSRMKARVD